MFRAAVLPVVLCLAPAARAASLDQLEVGGPWGTPIATDATAVWWNPAGLGAGEGTRFMIEGAPIIGKVGYDRTDPFGYDGPNTTHAFAVLPFAGVVSDFGVDGLGIGAALVVPTGRSGAVSGELPYMKAYPQDGAVPPDSGSGRYHLREAQVMAIHVMLAASYEIEDRVSLGVGVAYVDSTWQSRLDTELVSALDNSIEDQVADSGYTDDMVEDPRYAGTVAFEPLKDQSVTFNAGVRARIVPDLLTAGISYNHGLNLHHTGDVALHFSCPPSDDALGRFASERLGLCYNTVEAAGSSAYRLPARVNAAVLIEPTEALDVTVMGGWVGWSVFTDYEIGFSEVEARNPTADDPAALADALESTKLRARDARNTGWGGVDVKGEIGEYVLLGGRVLYDRAAIPTHAVSPNNYDADDVMLSGLAAFRPLPQLQIGLSYTHHVLAERVVTDSGWAVTVEDGPRNEGRWFYPHANGTYTGSISRLGVSIRGEFGNRQETSAE